MNACVVVVCGEAPLRLSLSKDHFLDQIPQTFDTRLAVAQLVRIVEIREIGAGKSRVRVDQRLNDLRVDLVADVGVAGERDHVPEARALGNDDWRLEA